MSVALYRKYRPKNFADVTNQNHIKTTLQNELESGRLGHAYLFCGPRGTGKTTLARLLAKAANCLDLQPNGEACNKCEICQEVLSNKSLDIIEIDAASHTGVDNVRENIINNARFTPTRNKYKVFIIDEVHMLSISAFNALLKILEEPPKYVIFILATTEAHKVPATIVSRCQRFDFKKIIVSELVERLRWISGQEEISVDDKVLSLIAKQAGGCVRDAESLLEQVFSLGEKNITLEQAELILPKADFDLFYSLFELLVNKNKAEAIILINKLVSDGVDISQFTDGFVEFIRKVLLYKVTESLDDLARDLDDNSIQKIIKLLPKLVENDLIRLIEICLKNKDLFKQNYLAQLPLEISALEFCQDQSGQNIITQVTSQPIIKKEVIDRQENKVEDFVAQEIPANNNKPQVKEVVAPAQTFSTTGLERILQVWPQVLAEIKETHYSLYMSLHMGKPVGVDGNKIVLGFLFELQRSRVDDIRSKSLINEKLVKTLGQSFEFEVIVDPSLSLADLPKNGNGGFRPAQQVESIIQEKSVLSAAEDNKDEATNIASEFGGTIVS